jgi:hypothetical protein
VWREAVIQMISKNLSKALHIPSQDADRAIPSSINRPHSQAPAAINTKVSQASGSGESAKKAGKKIANKTKAVMMRSFRASQPGVLDRHDFLFFARHYFVDICNVFVSDFLNICFCAFLLVFRGEFCP